MKALAIPTRHPIAFLCVVASCLFVSPAHAQDYVNVVLGERYSAGSIQRALLGDHYRDAWTSEIQLPVLNLRSFADGLTPERIGGGQQTISLVFLGENGRRYSFRLIDKDPTPALPPELRGTVAGKLFQDQISASHPLGVLIVNTLEDVAGVLHAQAEPFVLPDDPILGEFREQFAGQAGLIAERPGDEEDSDAIFGGFDNIDGTNRILRRMRESQTQRIDSRAFLNARLFDIWIGDWDRHPKQWTWARPEGSRQWLPIAEDRDHAFSRLDGLLPSFGHIYVRQFVGFEEDYPGMYGYHHQSFYLDRQVLADLELEDWNRAAAELQAKMTDQVIEDAVRRLPDIMYAVDGAFITRSLKARRDALPQAANDLYELLATHVEVHLTELPEHVEITSLANGNIEITAWPIDEPEGMFFQRMIDPGETEEVWIYMGDADDVAVIRGVGTLDVLVRVVGGGGNDEVRYDSNVGSVHYYDANGENQVTGAAPSHRIRTSTYEPPYQSEDDYDPLSHSGNWTVPVGTVSLPSGALIARFGLARYGYGFRKDPYGSRVYVGGAVSTRGRFEGSVKLDHFSESSRRHLSLDVLASQLGVPKFYGFGNDSRDFILPDSADVVVSTIQVEPRFGVALAEGMDVGVGLTGQFSNSTSDANPFLPSGIDPPPLYGAGEFLQAGAFIDFQLDRRDSPMAPSKGATLELRGTIAPSILDVTEVFGSVEAAATTYLSASTAPFSPTLALRAGGKKIWGDAPFFGSAFIGGGSSLRDFDPRRFGGGSSLRGFDTRRFAGDASLYGTMELRLRLFSTSLRILGDLGVIGFGDAGRVFIDGESPEGWHTSLGGGVWLGLLGGATRVSAVMANSEEGNRIYLAFGMPF